MPPATTVRLPDDLRQRLDAEAARDHRSMNRELMVLLTEALDARDRKRQPR